MMTPNKNKTMPTAINKGSGSGRGVSGAAATTTPEGIVSSDKRSQAVLLHLRNLCTVLPFHMAELWMMQGDHENGLVQAFCSDEIRCDPYLMDKYNDGHHESMTSRNMCKRAMQSRHGFYWISKKSQKLHRDLPLFTAASFHLPRDNINSDVFVVVYSLMYLKHSQSRLDYLYWMAHSTCVSAFSNSLFATDDDFYPEYSRKEDKLPSFSIHDDIGDMPSFVNEALEIGQRRQRINTNAQTPQYTMKQQAATAAAATISTTVSASENNQQNQGTTLIQVNDPSIILPQDSKGMHNIAVDFDKILTTNAVDAWIDSIEEDDQEGSFSEKGTPQEEETNARKQLTRKLSGYYRITTPQPNQELIQNVEDEADLFFSCDSEEENIKLVQESHDIDIDALNASVQDGSTHAIGVFGFDIDHLEIKRDIPLEAELNHIIELEFLAEGSNSHVFAGMKDNQPVVVKILQKSKEADPIALHEMDIETELLRRVRHKNIVTVLGSGLHPRPFIILERLQALPLILSLDSAGSTVAPSAVRRRIFTYAELLLIAVDLADALNYLHSQLHPSVMILHRDLKPDNLGMTIDGRLKLFDFGLCRCVQKRTSENETYEMTGNTGSLRYMAPEVVLNKPYTEKVDVYSFAMVIWTIARNKNPFAGFDRAMHRERVVLGGERPKFEKGWPADFCDLLAQCWHQNSTKRPAFSDILPRLQHMFAVEDARNVPCVRTQSIQADLGEASFNNLSPRAAASTEKRFFRSRSVSQDNLVSPKHTLGPETK